MDPAHVCRFSRRLLWGDWTPAGDRLERSAWKVAVCAGCGRVRPQHRVRPPVRREARAVAPAPPPLPDPAGRRVAEELARRGEGAGSPIAARGLLGALARRGIPASLAEEWLDRFLRAGWLAATWTEGGARSLLAVELLDRAALAELARPGEAAARRAARAEALSRTAALTHPKAREIDGLLREEAAAGWPALLVRALAALAVQVDAGEVLAARVFSARHLGDSKALAALRPRLERLVGPLAMLGVREGAAVTLVGGAGRLRLGDRALDLPAFSPFLGLARESVRALAGIEAPAGGLFVVENLAVFEACCRGEIPAAQGCLIVWSAGYPGEPVRRLVQLGAGCPLWVWADLDLDGVRIARLLASWSAGGARPFRMSPADLQTAPVRRPLTVRAAAAIRRDLEERPGEPLAETLAALLDSGCWAEQEIFLGGVDLSRAD
jgi:uncharacterized protein DUF2399